MDGQTSPGKHGFNYRQVLITLAVAWLVRLAFIWFVPPEAKSVDVASWESVADAFLFGQNPYQDTKVLNWPPLWMQMIYLLAQVSHFLTVPFQRVLQVFLCCIDSLVIIALFGLIRLTAPTARAFVPVLLGIALNPTIILLTCQHGNFDALMALWVLLFVGQLIQYHRSDKEADWLGACLFLGLGILTKTVPLALCPMLAGGLRRVKPGAKWLGVALVFGPVTLGMSIIYVLAPADVTTKVLEYRSNPGFFGVQGLLHLANANHLMEWANVLFYAALAVSAVLTTLIFWRRERISARDVLLYATLFFLLIPGLGGCSSQYLYWSVPLLVVWLAITDGWWRRWVIAFLVVAAATCLVEYGIFKSHGQFLIWLMGENGRISMTTTNYERYLWASSQSGQAVITVPLFVMFLVLLIMGIHLLVRSLRTETAPRRDKPMDGKTARG